MHPQKLIFFLALVLAECLGCYLASAQDQVLFKRINQTQGLSSGSVACIAQDEIGFIWIGTKNGLNRYDGLGFKIYSKKNSNLSADDISDLFIDSRGRLWVGTIGGGVNRYDPLLDEFAVYTAEQGNTNALSSNQINKIYEDSKGNLLVGTEDGLSIYNEDSDQFSPWVPTSPSGNFLRHASIKDLEEDERGQLWIATFGGGLLSLNKDRDVISSHNSQMALNFSSDFIYAIQRFSNDKLLIGTSGSGLLVFDIESENFTTFFNPSTKSEKEAPIIRTITQDSQGAFWVGTDGDGIYRIEEKEEAAYNVSSFLNNSQFQSSLAGNAIYSIFEDKEQNIWIGSAWRGVSVLEKNNTEMSFFYSDFLGENPLPVLSIYKNKEQFLLGSDGNGFSILNEKSKQSRSYTVATGNAREGSFIHLIEEAGDGKFWLGTFANGLYLFDSKNESLKNYRHQPQNQRSLSYNDVRDILPDSLGNFWVATWGGGLCYFDRASENFTSYRFDQNESHSISSDNALALHQAKNGKIWVATFGGGLNLFDPESETFEAYRYSESDSTSLASDNVLCLATDENGVLWVGTWGNGLCRYDEQTASFEHFDELDGIGNNTVTALQFDQNGNLWMSTKKGITKYDGNTFTNYPELSGEFHINSSFKDASGKLYFGGIEGVIAFGSGI